MIFYLPTMIYFMLNKTETVCLDVAKPFTTLLCWKGSGDKHGVSRVRCRILTNLCSIQAYHIRHQYQTSIGPLHFAGLRGKQAPPPSSFL